MSSGIDTNSSIGANDPAESWAIEPAAASRLRQRRWLSLAIMLVVFCSGAAIGSGLTTISIEKDYQIRRRNPTGDPHRLLAALRSELDLSAAQSGEVEQILQKHHEAVKKLWSVEVGPKMQTLVKQLDEQIAGVLTADQQPQWHAWLDKRKNRVCPPPSRSAKHARNHDGRRPPPHASTDSPDGEGHAGSAPAEQ